MPKLRNALPKYRKHKTGQAVVTIGGRDIYLGKYGTAASEHAYSRLVGEWVAQGRPDRFVIDERITTVELCVAFLRYAKSQYRKNGRTTDELSCFKVLLRYLRDMYGRTIAEEFGPKGLKAIRQHMIEAGNSRGHINKQIGRLKRIFKWAASEELAPVTTYQRLATVAGLQKGKSDARNSACESCQR